VKTASGIVLAFPCCRSFTRRRAHRKDLLRALRSSGSPVIVDLSDCRTLNHEDVRLLLRCISQVTGRDTRMLLAAGSRIIRVLLEVMRISSLVPVFDTVEEALADSHTSGILPLTIAPNSTAGRI
jgi:hypothetical protein